MMSFSSPPLKDSLNVPNIKILTQNLIQNPEILDSFFTIIQETQDFQQIAIDALLCSLLVIPNECFLHPGIDNSTNNSGQLKNTQKESPSFSQLGKTTIQLCEFLLNRFSNTSINDSLLHPKASHVSNVPFSQKASKQLILTDAKIWTQFLADFLRDKLKNINSKILYFEKFISIDQTKQGLDQYIPSLPQDHIFHFISLHFCDLVNRLKTDGHPLEFDLHNLSYILRPYDRVYTLDINKPTNTVVSVDPINIPSSTQIKATLPFQKRASLPFWMIDKINQISSASSGTDINIQKENFEKQKKQPRASKPSSSRGSNELKFVSRSSSLSQARRLYNKTKSHTPIAPKMLKITGPTFEDSSIETEISPNNTLPDISDQPINQNPAPVDSQETKETIHEDLDTLNNSILPARKKKKRKRSTLLEMRSIT